MLNKGILVLGSNYEKEKNVEAARQLLKVSFPHIRFAPEVYTRPVGCHNPESFLNQVALLKTSLPQPSVSQLLKEIETTIGRTPEDKIKEQIVIDIDLVWWNNVPLKPSDLSREYIRKGIEELDSQLPEDNAPSLK